MNSTPLHSTVKSHSLCSTTCRRPRRLYPSLRQHKKILNPPRLFVPLINIRNKKMKSWTHPASPILEKKAGTQKMRFQPALNKTYSFTPTPPNLEQLTLFRRAFSGPLLIGGIVCIGVSTPSPSPDQKHHYLFPPKPPSELPKYSSF